MAGHNTQQTMMTQAKKSTGNSKPLNAVQEQVKKLRAYMEASTEQLQMVLQTEEKVRRFQREFMTMVQGNPVLLRCAPKSLLEAAMQAAQLNLSLDKNMGQAYVVPYGSKAQFQIGYLGYLELARRSGQIKSIRAEIVYEGDVFERQYTHQGVEFHHTPCPPSQRGNKIGVYMFAEFTNGGSHFEFMFAEEVEEIKKLSKAAFKEDSIWKIHEEAMWKKTVIKRASKYLPLSVEAQRASRLDELAEAGVDVAESYTDTEVFEERNAS